MPRPQLIRSGDEFGRLTVLRIMTMEESRAHDPNMPKPYKRMAECLCSCGDYRVVMTRNLIAGATKSCGCWRDDLTKWAHRAAPNKRKRDPVSRIRIMETNYGQIYWMFPNIRRPYRNTKPRLTSSTKGL